MDHKPGEEFACGQAHVLRSNLAPSTGCYPTKDIYADEVEKILSVVVHLQQILSARPSTKAMSLIRSQTCKYSRKPADPKLVNIPAEPAQSAPDPPISRQCPGHVPDPPVSL